MKLLSKILFINKSLKKLKGILPKPGWPISCEEMNEIIKDQVVEKNIA
jgi:hypothetical protein